ncbi:MAG: serine/threonine protein kinase, partial [Lachnospiraceae bacterium]|nr:serine/threonine protein kinase [Lachnospiraceae bacterium]
MITINNRNLCENCFKEVSTDPCPYCGYSRGMHRHDPITLDIGSVLNDRYMIGRVIGKGGFGITYLAFDLKLDTRLAVKEYYPMGMAIRTPGSTLVTVSNQQSEEPFKNGAEKFYNEAKMVAKFNGNPNIVSVHDFFYENDTVYFTMGYLEGETLKSYLKDKRLTEGQAVRVMQDISSALMASHSMNILHRDVSPDNIMLCDDGSIKLLDFGAARQVIAEQSQGLSVILKQGFAPLEQYQKKGKQGPWTDIYALGATVYYALTGDNLDDPMTRMEDDSEFEKNKSTISKGLRDVLDRSLMLKSEDRYQDIFELKKDLNALGIEPETIVSIREPEKFDPVCNTAKAFESRSGDADATMLLDPDSEVFPGGNETVAIAPEEAVSYKGRSAAEHETADARVPGSTHKPTEGVRPAGDTVAPPGAAGKKSFDKRIIFAVAGGLL